MSIHPSLRPLFRPTHPSSSPPPMHLPVCMLCPWT
jgi:hypothetical protein